MPITKSPSRSVIAPLILILVPILGFLLYIGSLDDDLINEGKQVTESNISVIDPGDWHSVWTTATPSHAPSHFAYRPVEALLLRMEYQAWKNSPSSYHAVSMMLFLAVIVLFSLLAGRVLEHPGAQVAAALTLALHPMMSQAVENIAAQGVLLSLAASLGACVLLLRWRAGRIGTRTAGLTIGLLTLVAIGSCELGLLLPLWLIAVAGLIPVEAPSASASPRKQKSGTGVSPVMETTGETPAPHRANLVWLVLPILVIFGLYLFGRHHALEGMVPKGLAELAAAPPAIFAAYLFRLFWPIHPTMFYIPGEHLSAIPPVAVGWLVLAVAAALTVSACLRWRKLGLALILMLTPLAVLAHWVPLTFFMSEQFLPFAVAGFALAVGAVVARLTDSVWSFPPQRLRDRAVVAVLGVVWLAMAWQIWQRGREWSKAETLWKAEAARHASSAAPLLELIDYYMRNDSPESAHNAIREARLRKSLPAEQDRLVELEASLAADQKDDTRLKSLIDEALSGPRPALPVHLERMAALARQRDFRGEANDLLRRELEFFPQSYNALYDLAQVNLDAKNLNEAAKYASQAIEFAPSQSQRAAALERMGIILADGGQLQQAVQVLQQALSLDNTLYLSYIYLVRIAMGAQQWQLAIKYINDCFHYVGPRVTSYRDLAELYTDVLERTNRKREAVEWMTAQMDKYPTDIPLQTFGAKYLILFGRYERAYQAYKDLNALNGSRADQNLRVEICIGTGLIAFYGAKQPQDAARLWRQALQINPLNEEAKRYLDELEHPKKPGAPMPGAQTAATPGAPKTTPANPPIAIQATPNPAGPAPAPKTAAPAPSAKPESPALSLPNGGLGFGDITTPAQGQ